MAIGWEWTNKSLKKQSIRQVIGMVVVLEATFAKVEGSESSHAEGTFFAVITGS